MLLQNALTQTAIRTIFSHTGLQSIPVDSAKITGATGLETRTTDILPAHLFHGNTRDRQAVTTTIVLHALIIKCFGHIYTVDCATQTQTEGGFSVSNAMPMHLQSGKLRCASRPSSSSLNRRQIVSVVGRTTVWDHSQSATGTPAHTQLRLTRNNAVDNEPCTNPNCMAACIYVNQKSKDLWQERSAAVTVSIAS